MNRNEILAVIIIILATIGAVVGAFGYENYRRGRAYNVELIARAPENGNWYPGELRIPYGEEARILIRNIDTVTHGFTIPDFNVSITELKAGEARIVSFTPDKRGSFTFMCTVWCSDRHVEMRGNIVVE